MNIVATRLVLVGTKLGLVVMCKILPVVAFFCCARVNSTFLGRDSLPLVLILEKYLVQYKYIQCQQHVQLFSLC